MIAAYSAARLGVAHMKSVKALITLIDCGPASRRTRGTLQGFFLEANVPPYNRIYF